MITIRGSAETSFIVKKSKFIGYAVRAGSEPEAQSEIEKRRKQHYDATHNCFAYVLENGILRYSDDGEPQGTAGLPMLEVIKRSGLTDVLFICTRYFGGTLLGAGGLVHAYTKSAADTLSAAQKVELIPCSSFKCAFSYGVWAKAEKALIDAGYVFEDVAYADGVTAVVCVLSGKEDMFIEQVKSLSLGKTAPVFLGRKLTEAPVRV
jgi:uncharacterized YigZ family protein